MLIPIACRFIPYDQWFVTHLDDTWKVKQVKLWFLSKCCLVQSPGPHTHRRTVSPITFAPSVRSSSSVDSLDDGYNEDDEFSDQDLPPRTPIKKTSVYPSLDAKPVFSSPTIQPGSSPLVDRYTLLSFSTSALLEDDFPLSWYHLRPYELLEMHPIGAIAPLQRDVLAEYIQPYFQAKVKILRITWSHKSGRFEPPGIDGYRAKDKHSSSKSSSSDKRRKIRVEWKTRWVVINHGFLSLCKEHATSPPVQQFSLNSLAALRGGDALERAFSIVTEPHVVCIKFQPRSASQTGMASPPPSSPSSPVLDSNVQEPFPGLDPTSDTKQTSEQDDPKGEHASDPSDACKGDGDWVVLDMLDDHAFSSILRILHRLASQPISSSFAPSSSIVAVSQNLISSPVAASFAPYETIPYPEWRISTVENARKAGMGDVGKPMAWVLWTDKGLGESLLGNIRHHRQAFSEEMQYKTCMIAPDIYESDEENDDDSEMEWEGWVRDLERQSRIKQRSAKTGKFAARKAHPGSTGSGPLPSPPLSEGSSAGSPRVRTPSLSMSQVAASSFGSHRQYPNIGNFIQASGIGDHSTEFPRSPERIKTTTVSTVSVGTTPSPRRRSTTLSSEAPMTTKHTRDKGRQDKEPFSSIPSRTSTRTISASGGMRCMPSVPLRHARSSSNLRASSTSYGLDVPEPGPSSPPKRQSTFIRGVTQRAGKIVRGLESAIEFVDDKTTVSLPH